MLLLLPSSVFAESPQSTESLLSSFFIFGLMFVLMYFFMVRPQQKKANAHDKMLQSLTKNDEIVTQGGVLGKITKVMDDYFQLNVGEGMDIVVQRQAVSKMLPRGTIKTL